MTDERQAGLREALEEIRETAEYLADRGDEIDRVGRVAIPKRIARLATGALAALAAQVPAQEERPTPEGWEWQCASCHRPVTPMGMCETCGVFGIMRVDDRTTDQIDDDLDAMAPGELRMTDHALHFDPDCEECVYLARPVAIRVTVPAQELDVARLAAAAQNHETSGIHGPLHCSLACGATIAAEYRALGDESKEEA